MNTGMVNKKGTTLPQSSAPVDFISACATIKWHQQSVADERYRSDPQARIHRVLAGSVNQFQCWERDWTRNQCITMAQLHTGHSLLLAGYLHHIGSWDFATCPHRNNADETADKLVLQCPAHDQVRRDIWPGGKLNTDPRYFWDFLKRIGAVTHLLTGNERE